MSNVALKHTPSYKTSVPDYTVEQLMCVSAAKHHTPEQHSKTGKINHRKHLWRSNISLNTCQDSLQIPSLWESALETERRCFLKVHLESNVVPKILWSSDSFSIVPLIVNGGDWRWFLHGLETIILLVLLAFNFTSQRSHRSLTLPRSQFKDFTTVINSYYKLVFWIHNSRLIIVCQWW